MQDGKFVHCAHSVGDQWQKVVITGFYVNVVAWNPVITVTWWWCWPSRSQKDHAVRLLHWWISLQDVVGSGRLSQSTLHSSFNFSSYFFLLNVSQSTLWLQHQKCYWYSCRPTCSCGPGASLSATFPLYLPPMGLGTPGLHSCNARQVFNIEYTSLITLPTFWPECFLHGNDIY